MQKSRRFETTQSNLECSVCLCLWHLPVELRPCGHIFCSSCVDRLTSCPECRADVAAREPPNRIILNMISLARGKCDACCWVGTHEQFEGHACAAFPAVMSSTCPAVVTGTYVGGSSTTGAMTFDFLSSIDPSEYGLHQTEMDMLRKWWSCFANPASTSTIGRTRISDFCRFMNLAAFSASALAEGLGIGPTDELSLHAILLWMSLHRRHPIEDYTITTDTYSTFLQILQDLDATRRGLLDVSQVKFAARSFLGREVVSVEWEHIRQNLEQVTRKSVWAPLATFHEVLVVMANPPQLHANADAATSSPPYDSQALCAPVFPMELVEREKLQKRIIRIIMAYDLGRVNAVNELLTNFCGQEVTLLEALVDQYGPEK